MNLEQLNCLTAVVEEGSISAGARRLNLTQPPVSLQLQRLEAQCGVQLLEGGSRKIRLTEAGKSLYDTAKRIQSLTLAAQEDMKNFQLGKKGSLHLGMISSGAGKRFFRGIRYFLQKYPDIAFQLYEGNTYQLLDALEKETVDLAVIRTPFSRSRVEGKELCREKFCAVGMEDLFPHPVPETFALKDLQDLPLLGYRRWERIIQDTCRKQGFTLYFRCLADDARSCLQWAQAGLGVALVPESVVNLSQGLTAVPIQEQALESQVCLVRKKGRALHESARLFWENY